MDNVKENHIAKGTISNVLSREEEKMSHITFLILVQALRLLVVRVMKTYTRIMGSL